MDAVQFCGEHAREKANGEIYFTKRTMDNFITIYTYLSPLDFSDKSRELLKTVMIDYYNTAIRSRHMNEKDMPAEKVVLPDYVFM